MKCNFLFEIGTEEIPAGYIENATSKLSESFLADLSEYKLSYHEILLFSTPRRLAIKLLGVDATQSDETIERVGPAKKVAYDESGSLTKAGQGFITSTGVSEQNIYIHSTPKGDYIAVQTFIQGRQTRDLLPIFMKNAIQRIVFPKTMRWGDGNTIFARPIRWIVALCDDTVVDFTYHGIRAGHTSFGNRYEHLSNAVVIDTIDSYLPKLRGVKVIADREERRSEIRQQMSALDTATHTIEPDERLLDVVTDLVEFPTVVKATFDKKYLTLPSKIITSTLSQNQKYFSVVDRDGQLHNEFVFVQNADPSHSDIIKRGNEKVIKARLEDAAFYFQQDTIQPLDNYTAKLSDVVFHAKLGSLLQKTQRVSALCDYIAQKIGLTPTQSADISRASQLAKADLVTLMLGEKEFTKLQGYIGMKYATIHGEKPEVAQAIYEHYMPRGQNDDLPSDVISATLAVADKLDTICGIISIGLMPTGSADPLSIRRLANGVIQIIDKYGWDLSLSDIVDKSCELYSQMIETTDDQKIKDYLKLRLKWLLETYKIDYDVVDAIDIFTWDSVIDILARSKDLQSFKYHTDFEILVAGYKRVRNILQSVKNIKEIAKTTVSSSLFTEPSEIALYEHLCKVRQDTESLLKEKNYRATMEILVPIGKSIDKFFDDVMVICDDMTLQQNRLRLLCEINDLFLQIADISRIDYSKIKK